MAEVLDFHSRLWLVLIAVVLVLCCALAMEVVTQFELKCKSSYKVSASKEHSEHSRTSTSNISSVTVKDLT